ncbi:Chromosome partition protein Smc [invertebrate metagenome]|uniref:Chromosome partition protein Smc n=1 Tax=invertebrate metagenome TaxID=1711999 RepID=A0A2H9T9N8_9ZZZZ
MRYLFCFRTAALSLSPVISSMLLSVIFMLAAVTAQALLVENRSHEAMAVEYDLPEWMNHQFADQKKRQAELQPEEITPWQWPEINPQKIRVDTGECVLDEPLVGDVLTGQLEVQSCPYQEDSDDGRERMNHTSWQAREFFNRQEGEIKLPFEEDSPDSAVTGREIAVIWFQKPDGHRLILARSHQETVVIISCPGPDNSPVNTGNGAQSEGLEGGSQSNTEPEPELSDYTYSVLDKDNTQRTCQVIKNPIIDTLTCRICFELAQDARCLTGCREGHLGCKTCLEKNMEIETCRACGKISGNQLECRGDSAFCKKCDRKTESHRCMECRDPVTGIEKVSVVVRQVIDQLKVCCPNRGEGCRSITELGQMLQHINNDCLYRQVSCVNDGCHVRMAIIMLNQHQETCDYALTCCPYCHDEIVMKQLEWHQQSCDLKPLPCPRCHEEVSRNSTVTHCMECPVISDEEKTASLDLLLFVRQGKNDPMQQDDNQTLQKENDLLHIKLERLTAIVQDLETHMHCLEKKNKDQEEKIDCLTAVISGGANQEMETMVGDVMARLSDIGEKVDQITSQQEKATYDIDTIKRQSKKSSSRRAERGASARPEVSLDLSALEKRVDHLEKENMSLIETREEVQNGIFEVHQRLHNISACNASLRKQIEFLNETLATKPPEKPEKTGFFSSFGKGKK